MTVIKIYYKLIPIVRFQVVTDLLIINFQYITESLSCKTMKI